MDVSVPLEVDSDWLTPGLYRIELQSVGGRGLAVGRVSLVAGDSLDKQRARERSAAGSHRVPHSADDSSNCQLPRSAINCSMIVPATSRGASLRSTRACRSSTTPRSRTWTSTATSSWAVGARRSASRTSPAAGRSTSCSSATSATSPTPSTSRGPTTAATSTCSRDPFDQFPYPGLDGRRKEEVGGNLWLYLERLLVLRPVRRPGPRRAAAQGLRGRGWPGPSTCRCVWALGGRQLFPFVQPAVRYSRLENDFANPTVTPSRAGAGTGRRSTSASGWGSCRAPT